MSDAYLRSDAGIGRPPMVERNNFLSHAGYLVAALMWRKHTRNELAEITGANLNTLDRWLSSLHNAGVVRISGYEERTGNGTRARVWELQSRPFALEDVPTPTPKRKRKPRPSAARARGKAPAAPESFATPASQSLDRAKGELLSAAPRTAPSA